jgi:uncharacterized SAM-dependent methyltransferase
MRRDGRPAAGKSYGAFLIGVDMKKDARTLNRAYNDARGLTARFNRNLLDRMNRELEATFRTKSPEGFEHLAYYNAILGRIEMHLVSRVRQSASVSGITFHFEPGETIHTQNSYKYAPEEFHRLALRAGLTPRKYWQDENGLYSLHFLEAE